MMKRVGRTVFGVNIGCHALRRCCLKAVLAGFLQPPFSFLTASASSEDAFLRLKRVMVNDKSRSETALCSLVTHLSRHSYLLLVSMKSVLLILHPHFTQFLYNSHKQPTHFPFFPSTSLHVVFYLFICHPSAVYPTHITHLWFGAARPAVALASAAPKYLINY